MGDFNIAEVHEVELDLLKAFKTACQKLGLRYSLSSGTLLGAVRHKGFIPWDDDVDVMMLREDYDKFLKEGQAALSEIDNKYFLQTFEVENEAPQTFAKIRNSNTCWIDEFTEKLDINRGISMDIFPVDSLGNARQAKRAAKKLKNLNRLHDSYSRYHTRVLKNFVRKVGGVCYHIVAKLMGRRRIRKKIDEWEKKFPDGEYTSGDFFNGKLFPLSLFYEYGEIEFEGEKFSCIKGWDEYLKIAYGDYLQLPPESERVAHPAKIVDCKKSYTEYV